MSGISSFDFSALSGYYAARSQLRVLQNAPAHTQTASTSQAAASTALAPWSAAEQSTSAKLREAMSTTSFVDVRDSAFDKAGVSADAKKLFALYTGLTKL